MPNNPNQDLSIIEEAGLDPNKWAPIDVAPINPGAPAIPPASPQYMQGSISPQFQHDVTFVATSQKNANLPKLDLMTLAPSANPQVNAAVRSNIINTPASSASPTETITLDMPSIFTPITQTKTLPGPLEVALAPEPANTVFAGPPSSGLAGFDVLVPATGDTGSIVITGAPNAGSEWVMYVGFGSGLTASSNTIAGWTALPENNTNERQYGMLLPAGTAPITLTDPLTSSGYWVGGLYFLGSEPTFVQKAQIATGGATVTLNFANPTTAGNWILVIAQGGLTGGSYVVSAPSVGVPSDTATNTYYLVGETIFAQSGIGSHLGNEIEVYIAPAAAVVNGITFTIPTPTPSIPAWFAELTIYEITPISGISAVPTFRKLVAADLPAGGTGVSSVNSLTGAVGITSPDSSVTIGTSGNNVTLEVAAGSGVTSLNAETGAVVLESTGATINITKPDSSHINLDAANATASQLGVIELNTDLGGTAAAPQVVATHLASPLPLLQGGTGQTAPTLTPGTGISITGTWPDQTVTSTAAGSGVTGADNIIHMATGVPWWIDPAFVYLRDDFATFPSTTLLNTNSPTNFGELGWTFTDGAAGGSINGPQSWHGGIPPYLGQIAWQNDNTASNYLAMVLNTAGNISSENGSYSSTAYYGNAMALLDYPGWQCTWVWKHDAPSVYGSGVGQFTFTTTKKSFYVGLTGPTILNWAASAISARPPIFIGLRYDTSATPTAITLTGTTGAASGGNTVYNGTITNGNSGAFVGLRFVVTGFVETYATGSVTSGTFNSGEAVTQTTTGATATLVGSPTGAQNIVFTGTPTGSPDGTHTWTGNVTSAVYTPTSSPASANNGTFICTASSTEANTLTLNNPHGAAETHAGTATNNQGVGGGTGLQDAFYTLEVNVGNQSYINTTLGTGNRQNAQGSTFVTNVAPTQGTWHRLDIFCSSSGQITVVLDNSATNKLTATVNPMVVLINGTSQALNGNARVTTVGTTNPGGGGTAATAGNSYCYFPYVEGSQVTISGFTGTPAALNNSGVPVTVMGVGGGTNMFYPISSTTTVTNATNAGGQASGYPGLMPCFVFGNDDTATPQGDDMRTFVDFFGLVWNPNLGTGGTPSSSKPRGW